MSLIDTHCHIDLDHYRQDRAETIQRAVNAGVTRIINPAIDHETSQAIVKLTREYASIYGALGVHPNSTAKFDPTSLEVIEELTQTEKVVAIGEIGLDYYRDFSPKPDQKRAFEAQLALATKLERPIIIHNREASDDVMAVLEDWVQDLPAALRERPGVMHSFSAPEPIAERALEAGFYLGFTGPITFKKADDLRHIAAIVPLDRLLVETDAPYLTPTPHRGKRNEPAYVQFVAERLAALKQVSPEDMAVITTRNAERLFALPPES